MAKMSIDLFPFLTQLEADISPRYPQDTLAILAAYMYGPWRVTAKAHQNVQREIKEDI